MRLSRLIAAIVLSFPATAAGAQADDPDELARTWAAARVYLPSSPARAVGPEALSAEPAPPAVVLYAHGCDGPGRITDESGRFLARAGYLVIAPDSFARRDKPASCIPARRQGSLHRAVLGWRQAEIRHALDEIAEFANLAQVPVVLMGHSEGAIATATIADVPVAARIVEGWTCHAGWPEYRGLNAPPGQPVLSLVGEGDPWFRLPVLQGDCGAFMTGDGMSRSIVYRPPGYLHDRHWLSADSAVRTEILGFIAAAIAREGTGHAE